MKQTTIIAVQALLLALCFASSCGQKLETVPEGESVNFSAELQQKSLTRGKPINEFIITEAEDTAKLKNNIETFTVWGFKGDSQISEFYNRTVKVYGSKYYPLGSDGKFVQISPSVLTGNNVVFYGLASDIMDNYISDISVAKAGMSFKYTGPVPVTDAGDSKYGRDAENLREILTGTLLRSGVNESLIPLYFTHPLACVRFHLSADINKAFTVTGIKFFGIANQGRCSMTRDSEANMHISWSELAGAADYYQKLNCVFDPSEEHYIGSEAEEINNLTKTAAWILIPQSFDSSSSAHIEIYYTNYGVNHTLSIPLADVTWSINNEYWYIISKNGVIFNNTIYTWEGGVVSRDQYIEPGIYW